ncbi:MAG: SHOCT domain-containing protein [Nitrososphaerales archaeon]|nr:SHOCT domain-containing protein [Nitrososphaerales archaeon]
MQGEERHRGRVFVYIGLAIMFVLIGVAVLLGALYGNPSAIYYPYRFGFSFYWFRPMFGIFFAVWALDSVIFWPRRGRYMSRERWGDPSYEILRERYARGEITREQFDRMMSDLESR